ncbi:dihydropteroate synthase [Calothrix sp. 336/3]|uniref:dihydropteroate synthase n=1 Tax=Calothrix sp. 336/3 TaxID=1337936 RepID=UPI0004E43EC2|nr:dihydropteroate synthase [Calothrix sp. 336/3]AKG24462.1 dihydropteroate synthase [Calothrix sp. 336/3]
MTSSLKVGDRSFSWGQRTYIMGVLNVTPDSFSDGGEFNSLTYAVTQAQAMAAAGADIIDIGGQSTRPGAKQVTLDEELSRVIPVIQAIRQTSHIPISVDTTRAAVAEASIQAGADIINDISGGTFDGEMLPTVAKLNVPIILMHIRGNPETMQQLTDYKDLIAEISDFLKQQICLAEGFGIDQKKIIIDPGIGFAKNFSQNLQILRRLSEFQQLKCPILVGVSRKSFIGHILNQPDPKKRVWGTAAACCAAIFHGADILRVHDVAEIHDVAQVADGIFREFS